MKKILTLSLAAVLALSFAGCSKGTDTTLGDNDALVVEGDIQTYGSFQYSVNESGNYDIVGYNFVGTEGKAIEVPAEIDGRPVTGIGESAFKADATLTGISLPASITYIDDFAFYGCTGLTSVILPESVKTIGMGAFQECTNLKNITLSANLEEIKQQAFWNCTALGSITLPEKLTAIGDGAFWGCEALTEVSLPASLKTIGRSAFMFCEKLYKVTVNNAETAFGEKPFDGCADGLTIYAADESTARTYATDAGIKFEKLA